VSQSVVSSSRKRRKEVLVASPKALIALKFDPTRSVLVQCYYSAR